MVHKHCTKEQFTQAKIRLKEIEKQMCIYAPGFHSVGQDRPGSEDILAMSMVKRSKNETRDIGILFDDNPLQETFTFYAAKSMREGSDLYFKRADIVQNISMKELENNLESHCKLALEHLDLWKLEDLSKM